MRGLFPIKLQFFLSYGVLGSVGPVTALILKDSKGFEPREIGMALALGCAGLVFSPAIMTFLADRQFDSRRILRFAFASSGLLFVSIYFLENKTAITFAWAGYSILFIPALPLIDAYYFIHERGHGGGHDGEGRYQHVRVWGTIGFLAPTLGLYFLMDATGAAAVALFSAAAWCLLAIAGTYLLPANTAASGRRPKNPTRRAIAVLFSSTNIPLVIGLLLVQIAATAYYPYFSIYSKDEIGIPEKWIVPIMSIGVAIEIGYLYGLAPLRRLLRIKGIMVVGLALMALRLSALATFPTLATSLFIQLFHGMEILAMFVVPVIYLDRLAGDDFRNSIQGALAIVVMVPARLVGNLGAGEIAERWGSRGVIYAASALATLGMLILLCFFKPRKTPPARSTPAG